MVFFNNSGAEAVELAVKVARKYQNKIGNSKKYRVISIEGAFHGRSLAMLAAGRQAKHLDGFGPIVDGFDQVVFGSIDAIEGAITEETAAVIVEPVQGEGGIRPMELGYLRALRELCTDNGVLLIVDEVQSGIGRTGTLFAYERAGIIPDIMALAKGLGGGFPIGACVARDEVGCAMGAGSHGSTFGGNPLATAVGNAVLDVVLANGFLDNVNRMSGIFFKLLDDLVAEYSNVLSEVRGVGLMIGLKCVDPIKNSEFVEELIKENMLAVPAGDNVVRLIPPLIIDETHLNEAINILRLTCKAVGKNKS